MTALPFPCEVGELAEEVFNPFSGDSVWLLPEAVAVYDVIKGAEMFGKYDIMEKGLGWFRQNFPEEYMILLD